MTDFGYTLKLKFYDKHDKKVTLLYWFKELTDATNKLKSLLEEYNIRKVVSTVERVSTRTEYDRYIQAESSLSFARTFGASKAVLCQLDGVPKNYTNQCNESERLKNVAPRPTYYMTLRDFGWRWIFNNSIYSKNSIEVDCDEDTNYDK